MSSTLKISPSIFNDLNNLCTGPTVNNLSLLLRAGGGHVLDNISAVVDAINISLDGGLRVSRKSDPPLNEV